MIKYYFLGFFSVICIVATLNYYVDIENSFWRYKQYPAVAIPSDKVLVVPANRKERDDRINYMRSTPLGKCIVIGSSRSLLWGNLETSISDPISNLSVSTASIEEIAALYEAVLETGHLPSQLILSLDPWMVNEHAKGYDSEWLERTQYFNHFQSRVMKQAPNNHILYKINIDFYKHFIKTLISYDRLNISIKHLKREKYYFLQNQDELNQDNYAIRADGVLIYPKKGLSKSQEKIDREANETPNPETDYVFKDFKKSPKKWDILQNLILDAKEKNIIVMIVSPPFHPYTYERLVSLPMYKEAMADWQVGLKTLTRELEICDVTDPENAGCSKFEFMDGAHMKTECVKKIFQKCSLKNKNITENSKKNY